MAPAAAAAQPAQSRRVPPRAAAAQPDRHRDRRSAAAGAAGAAAADRRGCARWRAAMTARYNDLSAPEDGRGRLDLRPQSEAGLRARSVRQPNPVTVAPASCCTASTFHPGALAEHPGCRLDPVPGARLGRPCPPSARARTTSWCRCPKGIRPGIKRRRRAPRTSCASPATRCAVTRRQAPADLSSPTPPRTGGTARRSTAPTSEQAR